MKAYFYPSPKAMQEIAKLVRLGKPERIHTPKAVRRSFHTTLTHYMATEYRSNSDSQYFCQNHDDFDPYVDEFNDIDDEFDGLTIVEPTDEVDLFNFCTGYNVL
jgi:hypothetical protein